MRQNIVQTPSKTENGRIYLEYDWFEKGIPDNVKIAEHAFIDTSYGFAAFQSLLPEAMVIGTGSGCYDRASFIVGENGKIEIGEFTILNGSLFVCGEHIVVGNHCMFAWGSVITDSWKNSFYFSPEQRRTLLRAAAYSSARQLPTMSNSKPVFVEDNVWVGFDAVVLPGVRLGHGSIIGSKSVVVEDVPPYCIVAGNPAKVIRHLDADDTAEARNYAMSEHLLQQ